MARLYEDLTLGVASEGNPIGLVERKIETFQEARADGMNGANAVAVYEVPISRYNYKNGNGRVYSRELWENVLINQRESYVGSLGFINHPESKENMRDMCVVWGNGRIKEDGYVWWDMYLIGLHGETIDQAIKVGAKIGISSVGDGEADSEGNIKPETFKILRPGDIVYNPSQKVFAERSQVKEDIAEPDSTGVESDNNVTVVSSPILMRLLELLDCEESEIVGKVEKMKEFILKEFS